MYSREVQLTFTREKERLFAAAAVIQANLNGADRYLAQLHPEERMTYNSFRHHQRKESYLLGRLVAKKAIAQMTGVMALNSIRIDRGVFQFPVVRGENLQNVQVSISHCDDIGFCVAYPESHPVGVDVEKISPVNTAVIDDQLTSREKFLLGKQSSSIDYTVIFSIKEALSKVLRTGMMLNFAFLETSSITFEGQIVECEFRNFSQYRAISYRKQDYVFSLVLPRRTMVDLTRTWEMLDSVQVCGLIRE